VAITFFFKFRLHTWLHVKLLYVVAGVPWARAAGKVFFRRAVDEG